MTDHNDRAAHARTIIGQAILGRTATQGAVHAYRALDAAGLLRRPTDPEVHVEITARRGCRMTDIDARLERVLAGIARPGPTDDTREPDHEAERDMRHDPAAEMDAREDAYENGLY